MITEEEVPYILEKELPEINLEISGGKNKKNIFEIMQSFAGYTKRCAEIGNIDKLKSCFNIAAKLLRKGNIAVKSAVEKVYVFSVSSLIEIVSPIHELIKKMLPVNLKKDCLKHLADVISYNDRKDENCLFPNEIAGENIYYIPLNA